ncbi:hypothetical protein CH063_05428 [Colletotrichum higginsianum]|uniref:Uncharacterized protein n=2 Tax=Colletotrichum higginsianum TaxID=80884 RepID=H1UYZ1_COLHI|nr:uncharacterized protein CH63R_10550 [Colletotrichum higginsianum IMI 349063]OBR06430.1 hypothetical protein CH63R_10550 [Colletotrichum higginsianum IMI 349063]TIC97435.1 hypothetical protein CH35J_007363 [Colletotrichum higginsianum]CCF33192.1 hypothetical protein CH063_05428 [Colletotrichum higginsianum]
MDLYDILSIVRIVLVLLVAVPALVFFGRLLRQPGYRHDNTRRWVDLTKIATGLWGLAQLLKVLELIIYVATSFDQYYARQAYYVFYHTSSLLDVWAVIVIFLALFYLAHALTQLRTESQEESGAYRKGRRVVFCVAGLLLPLNLARWCLHLVDDLAGADRSVRNRTAGLIANCFSVAIAGILFLCATGSVVYSAKSRKKSFGSPLRKAGTLLVACSSLYLVREAWQFVAFFFFGLFGVFNLIDVFLGCWMTFAILTMLYLLGAQPHYSLSKVHYRSSATTDGQAI